MAEGRLKLGYIPGLDGLRGAAILAVMPSTRVFRCFRAAIWGSTFFLY